MVGASMSLLSIAVLASLVVGVCVAVEAIVAHWGEAHLPWHRPPSRMALAALGPLATGATVFAVFLSGVDLTIAADIVPEWGVNIPVPRPLLLSVAVSGLGVFGAWVAYFRARASGVLDALALAAIGVGVLEVAAVLTGFVLLPGPA